MLNVSTYTPEPFSAVEQSEFFFQGLGVHNMNSPFCHNQVDRLIVRLPRENIVLPPADLRHTGNGKNVVTK